MINIILGIVIAFVLIGAIYFSFSNSQENVTVTPQNTSNMSLEITSPAFKMNGAIPKLYTCDGEGISPELNFSNIPKGTISLALTMEDPDVPKDVRADGMWNHWIVWNMPPTTIFIKENTEPSGILGTNTSGKIAYGGPCPPDREHRYFFTLYALDTMLSLPEGSTKEELLQSLKSHTIEQATLVGRYNRNK